MSLRQKTILSVGTVLIASTLLLFFASRTILLDSYLHLEQNDTQHRVAQLMAVLSSEFSAVATWAHDYADWDDTYQFVQDHDPEYIESNFSGGETLLNLQMDAVAIIDTSNQMVFSQAIDLRTGEEIPLAPALANVLVDPSLQMHEVKSGLSGFLLIDDLRLMIAAQPIITSERQGPVQGTIIFVRVLDESVLERMSASVGLPLTAGIYDSPDLPADFQTAQTQLTSESPITTQTLNDERVAGYGLSMDVHGQPALIFRIDQPRSVYQQGAATMNTLIIALVVVSLVVTLVVLILLDRLVLARLAHLSADIAQVQADNPHKRMTVSGRDELTKLANEINVMLDTLLVSKQTIEESDKQLQAIFNYAPVTLWMVDKTGKLTSFKSANVAGEGALTAESSEINMLIEDSSRALNGETRSIVLEIGDSAYNARSTPLYDEKGTLIGVVGVATDVSELNITLRELGKTKEALQQMYNEMTRQNARLSQTHKTFQSVLQELRESITQDTPKSDLLGQINRAQTELNRQTYWARSETP